MCSHEQDRLLNMGLLEAARASWWHSVFLRGAGAKIGRGVYFDTITFSVSACTICCLSFNNTPFTLCTQHALPFLLTLPNHALLPKNANVQEGTAILPVAFQNKTSGMSWARQHIWMVLLFLDQRAFSSWIYQIVVLECCSSWVLCNQDFDLLTVEHGVAIDRNACVFCHVGIYRNGAFIIDQACPHMHLCLIRLPARDFTAL